MKLKKVFVVVDHDGPHFTDSRNKYDYTVFDMELRFNKEFPHPIPMYIDIESFKKRR